MTQQRPLRVLNLGAGVQSSVVLLMSCRGVLDRLDYAIFADTQAEPPGVYEHLDWLESQATASGIPLIRVTAGSLRTRLTTGRCPGDAPFFTLKADGSRGLIRARECTDKFKIRPIHKKIRELVGLKHGQRWACSPRPIEQWFGISSDEVGRVRMPRFANVTHRYPLVYELGMDRDDCKAWAAAHYPGRTFARSACVFCPYHDDDEWIALKSDSKTWAQIVADDAAIRRRGTRKARVTTLKLFRHECMGMCGL